MPRTKHNPLITNLTIARKDFTLTINTDKANTVTAMFRGQASFINHLMSTLNKKMVSLVPLMAMMQQPEVNIDDKIAGNKKLPRGKRVYLMKNKKPRKK